MRVIPNIHGNDNNKSHFEHTQKHVGTITQKGQVTIPVEVREYLQVQTNDKVLFEIRNGEVVLQKPNFLSLDSVFGAVTPRNKPEDFKTLRDNAIEEHLEKSSSLRA